MADARSLLHVGQISSVSPETASARVAFDDLDGHVSGDLRIIFPAMGRWRICWTPKVNDHTTVLRLPNGIQEGFILGTHYTGSNLPEEGADGLITLISEDGQNVICLDALTGALSMEVRAGVDIKGKKIVLEAEELTIRASTLKFIGNVQVNGNLSVTGDITNSGNMQTTGVHTDRNGRHGV